MPMRRWCWVRRRGTNARRRYSVSASTMPSRSTKAIGSAKSFSPAVRPKRIYDEAEVGRRYALKQGIPAHNILFENTSRNTYENLRNVVPIMHANGVGSIIVVSDPYHLARAEEMAADLGLSDAQFSATPTTRFDERNKKAKFLMQESYSLFLYRIGKWSDAVWNWIGG